MKNDRFFDAVNVFSDRVEVYAKFELIDSMIKDFEGESAAEIIAHMKGIRRELITNIENYAKRINDNR